MTKDQMETKKTVWYIKVNNPYEMLGVRTYWARSKDEANAIASVLQHMHKRALVSVSEKKPHDLYGKVLDWRLERHERDIWSSVDRSQKTKSAIQALGYDLEVTFFHAPAQHKVARHNETWMRKNQIFYCYSRDYKLTRHGKAIEKAYIDKIEKDQHTRNQTGGTKMSYDESMIEKAFRNNESLYYHRDDSLLSDIIKTVAKNEEGPRIRKLDNGIRVYTRNSQHPELNFNGGDYDHYTNFLVDDDGHVIAFEDWSADFDYGCVDTVVYGKHTVAELHTIVDSLQGETKMEKYIRTNNDGDLVLDHHLLNEGNRQDFIAAVKNIAAGIELEFDPNDPDFSEAEINEGIEIAAHVAALDHMPDDGYVYTDKDTKLLLAEIIEQELRNRYRS